MKIKYTKLGISAALIGGAITIAACTSHKTSTNQSQDNFLLGKVDGKEVFVADLSESDKNALYKNQKQFYDSTESLLSQHYMNQYLETYRKKNKLESIDEAKKDFFEKNAKVDKAEVDKFLKDNENSPQMQQIPADKRAEIVSNYLSQMAQSKATQNIIQQAVNDGKIAVQMGKPVAPKFTFNTEGYNYAANAQAPVTIVEFADFQCPYCVMAHTEVKKVLEHYNKKDQTKVQFVYYDFPLSFHDQALPASVAAFCASEQGKYWSMHDKIFERDARDAITSETFLAHAKTIDLDLEAFKKCQGDKKSEDFVNKQMAEGMRVGVQGTPAIFINGVKFEKQTSFESLKSEIDAIL